MPSVTGPVISWRPAGDFSAPPATGQVHLWLLPLNLPESDLNASAALLSPDEAARAARLILPLLRMRFTAARAGLRRLLGGYLNLPPAELSFIYSPAGKPALARPLGLTFNLSHSGDLALAAFAASGRLGVDLEEHRPELDRAGLARRFFSPAEADALESLPLSQQVQAFYAVWTRKEAFLKATGAGLACPLDTFEVTVDPGREAAFTRLDLPGEHRLDWRLTDISLPPAYRGFSAALASDSAVDEVKGFTIS
jgi:4'-phosphopantetheinyl transferase